MIAVPAAIEEALWEAARRHLSADVLGAGLAAAVTERSRRYTSEREKLSAPLSGAAAGRDLAARALFFTVADVAKAIAVLRELPPREGPTRIVDLGAGAGAMSLGALVALPGALSIEAIDRDAGALAILADAVPAAARALGREDSLTTRREDVTSARIPPTDLVLLGSVLNELDEPAAQRLVERALAAIGDDGAVVIVEPALREQTRALHRLRAAMLGRAHAFAPCTHDAACPMLADERDWCHEERVAALPPRTAHLAQVTGLRDGAAKFSYLVLRRAPGHVGGDPAAVRVVGHPHRSKGKLEAPVCGASGLIPLRLLARHRGDATRAFERARRGDLLRITPAASADHADLDAASAVEPIAPS